MPRLYTTDGVSVVMYPFDHPPPHVHLRGSGVKATIGIEDRALLRGELPKRSGVLLDWIEEHRDQLMRSWERGQQGLLITGQD